MSQKLTTNLTAKDMGSTLNTIQYIVNSRIRNMVNTVLVVKVVAVNGDKIDVQNAIQDTDNNGTPIGNFTIPNVRYMKWQYGTNKIMGTPAVGDIGLLLVSKQDISGLVKDGDSVAQTKSAFNLGDGVYIGGLEGFNAEPTQYIKFDNDSVEIVGTGTIKIKAPTVNVEASSTASVKSATVNVEATGTATVKGNNVVVEATTSLKLGGSSAANGVARIGDSVNLSTGKITGGSSLVKCA